MRVRLSIFRSCAALAFAAALAGCSDGGYVWRCDGGSCEPYDCGTDCGGDEPPGPDADVDAECGDGRCDVPAESAASCPDDCSGCTPLADVTGLIGGDLFFGYAVLGTDAEAPSCGGLGDAKEVIVSLTPDFAGDLVLSTVHPSTQVDTVIEVREESCRGTALGCNDVATAGTPGSRLTVPVVAGTRYVALVETADDEAGVFALGLHPPGVCEGQGATQDITGSLLTGQRFSTDTSASTSSASGTCGGDASPEARFLFTAPRSGVMLATTVHPATAFDAVLHVREGDGGGVSFCDSPETEAGCAADGAPGGLGPLLRFEAVAGIGYDLFVDGAGGQGPATLTLGYAATSPARATLQGCDFEAIRDQFAFFAQAGQAVFVKVDTVDAATAADTRLLVRSPDGSELHEADDDVACTFPPPEWSCPQWSFTAGAAGLYTVEVYVGSSERCADRSRVNYELAVDVADAPAELIHIRDQ